MSGHVLHAAGYNIEHNRLQSCEEGLMLKNKFINNILFIIYYIVL